MSIKTWTPKLGSTKVRIEPDNHVDKFAVCVEKKMMERLASGRFSNTIFYFLRSDYYSTCV